MPITPVPDEFTAPIPMLGVHDAVAAIEFYKSAFGATEVMRLDDGDRIGHAELRIGKARYMLADEYPEHNRSPRQLGGTPVILYLYVQDADETFRLAVSAGARSIREPADQFYGDRMGKLEDPFGHVWMIASRKEKLPAEETPND